MKPRFSLHWNEVSLPSSESSHRKDFLTLPEPLTWHIAPAASFPGVYTVQQLIHQNFPPFSISFNFDCSFTHACIFLMVHVKMGFFWSKLIEFFVPVDIGFFLVHQFTGRNIGRVGREQRRIWTQSRLPLRTLLKAYVGKNWWRRVTLQFGKNQLTIWAAKSIANSLRILLFALLKILIKLGLYHLFFFFSLFSN